VVAVRLFVPTPAFLRTNGVEPAARALLSGLAALREGEQVVVRWALRPGSAPERRGEPADRRGRERERAWRRKAGGPGFRVAGLVLVRAAGIARARELAEHVVASLRSRGAAGLRPTWERSSRGLASLPRTTGSSGWLSVAEALGLLAWPLGTEAIPGVTVGASRELPVPRDVPREGRRLFLGWGSSGERPVALSPQSSLHHLAVVGPTGVGKSALLANAALQDIGAGYGGAILDPKDDLVEAILDRVPAQHAERVVVLDPAAGAGVPGLALLSAGDPELRSDVIVGALKSIFHASWGIRSELYMRLAVRTLAEVPGAALSDVGRLFADGSYRRAAVRQLRDPFLAASWTGYEALSAGEKAQHVQSPMAKVTALLSRPSVRRVLSSPDPRLDIPTLLRERRWLLVPLGPSRLGEPASQFTAALVLYCLWAAVEARAILPPAQRHPIFITLDELPGVARLPFSFESLAERSRGLGAGLSVGVQSLARLPESLRVALLANVASLVTFRAGADDAARLARELPGLGGSDVQGLGRFEVAARVGTGIGSSVAVMTGRTEPLGPVTGQAERIRALSAERYGSRVTDEVREAVGPQPPEPDVLGRGERR
jgi:hypothetical protein